jgi:hypothetical protein
VTWTKALRKQHLKRRHYEDIGEDKQVSSKVQAMKKVLLRADHPAESTGLFDATLLDCPVPHRWTSSAPGNSSQMASS